MKETKPKNIKAVGIGIIAVAAIAMISNGSFLLIVNYVGGVDKLIGPESLKEEFPEFYLYWYNIFKLAIVTSIFSLLFLIGGIFLFRLNRFSRIILTSIAILYTIVFIIMSINLILITLIDNSNPYNAVILILSALTLIVLMILLIIYVNKKQIRKHFK